MNFLSVGLLDLSGWGVVAMTLVLTHITIASVTIYLHRHQAHRALVLHPVISHFFRFWLWLTTGMVTRQWVAIHRKHHARCETAEDPHSPQFYGLKTLLLKGAELYRAEAKNAQTLERFGAGTPDDWIERNLYSRYPQFGIVLMLLLDVLLLGVIGITVFAVQMLWIPVMAAGVINGVGHYFGYRNFEVEDASRNILPWGIIIGGEELHNNHHAYPSSAKLSNKGWEFDLGWLYIRLLNFIRLARVLKVAPQVTFIPGKKLVDMDTVRAIVGNRFHVVKLYGRKVIRPVMRDEYRRANDYCRTTYRWLRKSLTREDIHLDSKALEAVNAVLARNESLATVYRFKRQLMELWTNSRHNHTRRLERLQAWCTEAEQSGIAALQEFAQAMRGYAEIKSPAI